MAVLDFTEIPASYGSGNQRDRFELFARDFLKLVGYEIVEGPDRGIDAGRDLITIERRLGVGGQSTVRWLVSCKHLAHSGSSVKLGDEPDILERLRGHNCAGFVGFYSTLPSSGVTDRLKRLQQSDGVEWQVFDNERIEGFLLSSPAGMDLAKRYFPKSAVAWTREHPTPARLFLQTPSLKCATCDRELLDPPNGVVIFGRAMRGDEIIQPLHHEAIAWTCYGACDMAVQKRFRAIKLVDGWRSIEELCNPTVYAQFLMAVANTLRAGETYSDNAFDSLKELLLNLFPHVARDLTLVERERLKMLSELPTWAGGVGP